MLPVTRRRAWMYVRDDGSCPFEDWLDALSDRKVRTRVHRQALRLGDGNWGDYKALREGLFETRIHHGSGWRVYFGLGSDGVIVIYGGSKGTQKNDIEKARELWREHESKWGGKKPYPIARDA
jgi:putative addiction module killer protein